MSVLLQGLPLERRAAARYESPLVTLPSSLALGVALLSSLSWAMFDASRKSLVRRLSPESLLMLFASGQLPCFLLALGVGGAPQLDAGYLRPGMICLAANVSTNLLFFHAVKLSTLSRCVPMLALTPVFTAVIGFVLLDERPSGAQLLGILFIVCGAVVLGLHATPRPVAAGADASQAPETARDSIAGPALMIVVALSLAISAISDKLALPHANVAFHASVQTGGVMLVAFSWLALRGRLGELRLAKPHLGAVAFGVLVSVAALGLQLLAIQSVLVSLMESIKRALGVLASVLSGRVLFGEPITRNKLGACVLMAVGVVLVV